MSLYRVEGWYEADFRFKDKKRLHLLMRTKKKSEAQDRYDAVRRLFREDRDAMIEQLRSGILTVEHLARLVRDGEPLLPIELHTEPAKPKLQAYATAFGTLDDVISKYASWLQGHPNRAKRTKTLNIYQANRLADFEYAGERLGAKLFGQITWPMIEAYQASLIGAETPTNTITVLMSRVGAIWRWQMRQEERAAREERREPVPIYLPIDAEMVVREHTKRERVLSVAEIERLIAATPAPLLFPVACGVFAGLRLNEVLHLRPQLDVDFVNNVLWVRAQGDVWQPKTKRSVRTVPMTDLVRQAAEAHVREFASDSWMLPRVTDAKLAMHDLVFRGHFKAIVLRAELAYGRDIAQGVTFHTLRHTFATLALESGVDLYTVAQLLGDKLSTVEDTYAHLSRDFKRAAVAKVAAAYRITPGGATE